MGLAASQARFLGITARKSNIEYEGQQVNQQRTALAEEVNSLYNKLLSIKVPVAPDTTAFYETNYSFAVTNDEDYQGDYLIKSYFPNDDGTGSYTLITNRTYDKSAAIGTELKTSSDTFKTTSETDKYTYNNGNGTYTLTAAGNSDTIKNLINSTYGEGTISDTDQLYYFIDDKNNNMPTYIPLSQITGSIGQSGNKYSTYVSGTKTQTESLTFTNAKLTFDTNNRISNVSIPDDPTTGQAIGINADVNTTRTYDQEGYEAALRDYTMSKEEYDKKVADLNAQTQSLQQEDKVLEMRLNQIDTEQNELQTELDAVKAVLDKNIEKTFNTFS